MRIVLTFVSLFMMASVQAFATEPLISRSDIRELQQRGEVGRALKLELIGVSLRNNSRLIADNYVIRESDIRGIVDLIAECVKMNLAFEGDRILNNLDEQIDATYYRVYRLLTGTMHNELAWPIGAKLFLALAKNKPEGKNYFFNSLIELAHKDEVKNRFIGQPDYLEALFILDRESMFTQRILIQALDKHVNAKAQTKAFNLLKMLPKLRDEVVDTLLEKTLDATTSGAAKWQTYPARLLVFFHLRKQGLETLEAFISSMSMRGLPARPDLEWAVKELKKRHSGLCSFWVDGIPPRADGAPHNYLSPHM